jgi:pimeloyl-ACP methyl ester carboxylesterase
MRGLPAIARARTLVLAGCLAAGAAEAAGPGMHRDRFDSAGVPISWVEAGEGEPVLLVHGLYSNAELNWVLPGTFAMLAEHHRVIAPDLRGHGRSGKPTGERAYGAPMVEDLVRLMDHLHVARAHVVGYSLGGVVVMKLLVDHPDRVLSATLGGMGWLRDGSFEQALFGRMGRRLGRRTPPACVHGIARLAVGEAELRRVTVPVEVVVGDRDPCRRLYVEPLRRLRPDWPVVVVRHAGHLDCVVKAQFRHDLARWLATNERTVTASRGVSRTSP